MLGRQARRRLFLCLGTVLVEGNDLRACRFVRGPGDRCRRVCHGLGSDCADHRRSVVDHGAVGHQCRYSRAVIFVFVFGNDNISFRNLQDLVVLYRRSCTELHRADEEACIRPGLIKPYSLSVLFRRALDLEISMFCSIGKQVKVPVAHFYLDHPRVVVPLPVQGDKPLGGDE